MSYIRSHSRLLLIFVCCVAVGAGASAIAAAGAATGAATGSGSAAAKHAGRGGLRRLALRAVHGSAVVHTRQGFVTVTYDRGTVDAVEGRQLTIAEGTRKASYRTVTLTIPAGARVRDNRHKASLSDVRPGQRVIVVQTPTRTLVIARTPRS